MKKFLKKYSDEDLELALDIIQKEDQNKKQDMIDKKHIIVPILLHDNLKVKLENWVKNFRGKERPKEKLQPIKKVKEPIKEYKKNRNSQQYNKRQNNIKKEIINMEEDYEHSIREINDPLLKKYTQEELELAITAIYTQELANNLINSNHKVKPLLLEEELKIALMTWNQI